MAFGNGAPDLFTSIASVLSVKESQADLAISELLGIIILIEFILIIKGGGIFVTTIVVATIILTQPFNVMRRPVIRDILFYLATLMFLICIILTNNEIKIWMPICNIFFLIIKIFSVSFNLCFIRIDSY